MGIDDLMRVERAMRLGLYAFALIVMIVAHAHSLPVATVTPCR